MSVPQFKVGDRVQVLHLDRWGHIRTPFYIRGKAGRVECYLGQFISPEDLGFGNTAGPVRCLYKLSFRLADLWEDYSGEAADSLHLECYEDWLSAAHGADA